MNTRLLGIIGEKKALKYLKRHFFKILEHNYTTKIGEIDIIAKKGKVYCFIEVKYRTNDEYGLPRESVTDEKQAKIKRVAQMYILEHDLDDEKVEFDVLEVTNDGFNLLREAF